MHLGTLSSLTGTPWEKIKEFDVFEKFNDTEDVIFIDSFKINHISHQNILIKRFSIWSWFAVSIPQQYKLQYVSKLII